MKKYIASLSIAAILLTACNNSTSDTGGTDKDSASGKTAAVKVDTALVSLSGSKNVHDMLSQAWELEDDIPSIADNDDPVGMIPFRSFYFSGDGSFVKNPRNLMEYGKWNYDSASRKIALSYSGGGKGSYKLSSMSAKVLKLVNLGENDETVLKFVSLGLRYKYPSSDPWHISNQSWRIKPSKSEDDAAVHKRLKDCIHFYVLFYKDAIAKKTKQVSFYGLPTCIKWYAGGIYIVSKDKLATNWIDCFYNEAQAFKAQAMMDDVMSKKYTWPKDRNLDWVQKNLAVLEQMYANL